MDYKTWKNDYEAEMDKYRTENVVEIYDKTEQRKFRRENPNYDNVGLFSIFVKKDAIGKDKEILAKYENLLLNNIEAFTGFVANEFERIKPFKDVDERLSKIFQYQNMEVRVEDLSEEQKAIFDKAVEDYKEKYSDLIERFNR